jgi:hypothetical protein
MVPQSYEPYARRIAEWWANGRQFLEKPAEASNEMVSVNQLILGYLKFALPLCSDRSAACSQSM